MTQTIGDARTFRGRLVPGPGKCSIRIYDGNQEYKTAGPDGTEITLWLPRPNNLEGIYGTVEEEAQPYFDQETNQEYKAIYPKGSIVVIGKFTGAPVTVNNDRFIVCRETDIVAMLIPETPAEKPVLVSASASVKTPFDS